MTPLDRARRYLDRIPPAISGQGGHNQTFEVACALTWGFELGEQDAWALLCEYNQRCQPEWSEKELRHKLEDALKTTKHEKPRGHLLRTVGYRFGGDARRSAPSYSEPKRSKPAPAQRSGDYKPTAAMLPKPIDDAARMLILAAFEPGEGIGIAQESLGEDGRGVPKDAGYATSREEWLDRLAKKGGDPNKIFSSTEKTGAFIRVNPLNIGGSKDSDVIAFRHVLLEFDKISAEEQWSLIEQSRIPCTAVLHSGNKSLHAWVRVDAETRHEYDERVKYLFNHFAPFGPDEKNKNPSRFSRLPGMVRGQKRQELLALPIKDGTCAQSWQEWSQTEGEGLPRILNVGAQIRRIVSGELRCPDEIVSGILHKGHKLVLGGGSKTNKTWCLIDLALSVATGTRWLGYGTLSGNVLYLNFEVDEYHFHKRIEWVAGAKGIPVDALENQGFDSWCLRGHTRPYDEMIPSVLRFTQNRNYSLIVLDPLYKLMGQADENKATDITQLLNSIEELASKTGAATAFGAHFSKGNQAGKEAIDRISGSGVFARDPDTIMLLTRHEQDDCFVVDFTLRNFKSVPAFGVRWEFPMLMVDGELDPKKLKQVNSGAIYTVEQVVEALTQPMRNHELLDAMKKKHGIGDSTFNRLLKQAVKQCKVKKSEDKDKVVVYERS